MFIDLVVDATKGLLEEEGGIISQIVSTRARKEVWFQEEIYARLIKQHPNVIAKREEKYPPPYSSECCDFWCRETVERQSWVELKLCTTAYLDRDFPSRYNRSITTQINNLLYDIVKLRRLPQYTSESHVLLLAYPMPIDYATHGRWPDHIASIRAKSSNVVDIFSIAHVVGYRIDLQ